MINNLNANQGQDVRKQLYIDGAISFQFNLPFFGLSKKFEMPFHLLPTGVRVSPSCNSIEASIWPKDSDFNYLQANLQNSINNGTLVNVYYTAGTCKNIGPMKMEVFGAGDSPAKFFDIRLMK